MSMIELDEQKFNKIISSAIIKQGFEYTFEDLLYKFLEKIGVLWQTGAINPAQEHFITQLIRQKIILAIDGQHALLSNHKTFLLFLPENEYHELGLLFMHFLIRKAGHMVIYLGQNVPLINLKNIFEVHKVDFLLTSLTSNLPEEDISALINEFTQYYSDKKILIGGNCLKYSTISLPENFTFFNSISDLTDYLSKV
jgi:methanogenic corrinoid protein MtbC1